MNRFPITTITGTSKVDFLTYKLHTMINKTILILSIDYSFAEGGVPR